MTGSEGDFEPGSNAQVLHNYLGITDSVNMYAAEAKQLADLYVQVFDDFQPMLSFYRARAGDSTHNAITRNGYLGSGNLTEIFTPPRSSLLG